MTRPYQVCSHCVMDTTDPEIDFDANGVCNHCRKFDEVTSKRWHPNLEGERLWQVKLAGIRAAGRGKEYDCIIGLSGGVDSSYLALKAKDWGLRPLVVHVDAGWNSELAVSNIECVVKACNYDLHTIVIDWPEMRDLQIAFLKSGVANQDVPQDHAFFANLYEYATKNNVRYILSGGNIATESIFPATWQGDAMDAINLKAIHNAFGRRPLKRYKTISFLDYYFRFPFIHGMRTLRPLNFMPYSKQGAIAELQKTGWRAYGRKHGESRFTQVFQNYYLPEKFGFDKRRPHYASLIVSGQISRDEGLTALAEPLYAPADLATDLEFFCKKLGITQAQFEQYLREPNRDYSQFDNWDGRKRVLKAVQKFVANVRGRNISVYS